MVKYWAMFYFHLKSNENDTPFKISYIEHSSDQRLHTNLSNLSIRVTKKYTDVSRIIYGKIAIDCLKQYQCFFFIQKKKTTTKASGKRVKQYLKNHWYFHCYNSEKIPVVKPLVFHWYNSEKNTSGKSVIFIGIPLE